MSHAYASVVFASLCTTMLSRLCGLCGPLRLQPFLRGTQTTFWRSRAITLSDQDKELVKQCIRENRPLPKRLKLNGKPPKPMWLIKEDEIEEKFVKGGGPGGQKVNKTSNKVQLRHLPTGLVVLCHLHRLQQRNRDAARENLAMQLEAMQSPDFNRLMFVQKVALDTKRNREKRLAQKARKLEQKQARKDEKLARHTEYLRRAKEAAEKRAKHGGLVDVVGAATEGQELAPGEVKRMERELLEMERELVEDLEAAQYKS